jgi:hypothetical protein
LLGFFNFKKIPKKTSQNNQNSRNRTNRISNSISTKKFLITYFGNKSNIEKGQNNLRIFLNVGIKDTCTGVQSINNVFHIVDKVENLCVNKYIFDLIDNVEYVVYALYSSVPIFNNRHGIFQIVFKAFQKVK